MAAGGYKTQAGFLDAASWGTAWAEEDTLIPFVSEDLTTEYDKIKSMSLTGSAAEKEFEQGHKMVQGNLNFNLDYDNSGLLFYAFGSLNGSVWEFEDDLDEYFALTIDKVTARYQFASCMINTLTISGEAGADTPIQCSAGVVAYDVTTSATAFASLSMTEDPVIFPHLSYFRIGDQADALAAGDNIDIQSFEISIDNKLELDAKDTSGTPVLNPGTRTGFREVTFRITLPRYDATNVTNFTTWKDAGTRLQASFYFVSGGESVTVNIPECKIAEGANWNVDGPGPIAAEVSFRCFYNNNNTPMAAAADQMEITVV